MLHTNMFDVNHLDKLSEVAITYLSAYIRERKRNETQKIRKEEIHTGKNFCYQLYIKILNKI